MVTDQLRRKIEAHRSLPPPAIRRAVRQAAGVTQADVAEALGVARETVWRWEAGTRTPCGRLLVDYVDLLELMRGGRREAL